MAEKIGDESSRKPGYLKIALQLLVIALFALMIVYFMRKYSADISNLRQVSLPNILMIGAWSFVSYTAYAYAVYVVLVAVGLERLGPFGWFKIYFVSRLANLFMTQGGNVFRLVVLKKKYGFSYTNSIGVTAFLVWINAVIALLASTYFLAGLDQTITILGLSVWHWTVLAALMLLFIPPAIAFAIFQHRNSPTWQIRLLNPFERAATFFITTIQDAALFSKVTLLSIVHFGFFLGVNYLTFRAIGQPIDLAAVCLFTTAFVFTRYLNIVPGNLGVSELVGGLVSELMGVGFGNGLIVSGIVRIVEVIMILLIGLIYGKFLAFNHLRQ